MPRVIVYYTNTRDWTIEERCAEKFGHPNMDSAGEIQFDNTHFLQRSLAEARLLIELRAAISLAEILIAEGIKDVRKGEHFLEGYRLALRRLAE
jgi:hypothetical protein